jgi:hypothetical protein
MNTRRTTTKSSSKTKKQDETQAALTGLAVILIAVIVVGAVGWYFLSPLFFPASPASSSQTSLPATTTPSSLIETCVEEGQVSYHIHVRLSIVANGERVPIPANIGIAPGCTWPIHTHDAGGTIHIESPVYYPFTLGDFFNVWGKPFDSTRVLDFQVGPRHSLRMFVNGAQNLQFQNYVLQDGDEIQIVFETQT